MANYHITVDGDSFDLLALRYYSDEKLASHIIQANPEHCGVLIFEAGVVLEIPDTVTITLPETLPPWRRNTA